MVGVVTQMTGTRSGVDPSARGYQVLFRANESNRCPGCGRAQWLVGRVTAECVFCGTALPLAEARWGERGHAWTNDRAPIVEEAVAEQPEHDERRRRVRKAGDGRVVHLLLDGVPHAFDVHNYSASGIMIDAPAELISAKQVEIVAPSGEIIAAEVRWTESAFSGLQFAKPVPLVLSRPRKL